MKIIDLIKKNKPALSFEFFPPKSDDMQEILFNTISSLKEFSPNFASVTYGAGGSSTDKTLSWSKKIKSDLNSEVMMHVTCVGFSKEHLDNILMKLKESNIENILALRGDLPKDFDTSKISRDFKYASDLVKYIKSKGDFCLAVAAYPEKHPEAKNFDEDINNLKLKVDNGADFIATQLFFDNEIFYKFRDKLVQKGIKLPIVAGIMPIVNANQIVKFTQMCGATLPKQLLDKIIDKSEEEVMKIGVEHAYKQSEDLKNNGIDGIHFYTLNRSNATASVLKYKK